jgi:ADP-heptose:LPS heptosyltransferase
MKKPHLLLLRFSALGDVAMTVPVIRCLYKSYPNLKITFVSRTYLEPLFEEFENFNFYPIDTGVQHKGVKGIWTLFSELKKTPFSGVADLHGVLRTYLLSFLFTTTFFRVKQINKGRIAKHRLIREKNKKFQPLTPTIFRYTDVFRKLGFSINIEDHEFPDKKPIPENFINLYNQSDRKWIGIAPFASYKGKTYPLDLMQQVIAYLQKDYQIFLFGAGQKEIKKLEVWEKAYTNAFNTAGNTSLRDQIQIMPYLDLMISMDSANGHLAANFGTPVLSLWGLTHPFCGFAPFCQPKENSLTLDRKKYPLIPTSVYGNVTPSGYENAFRSLQPKEVIEKALELVKK